MARQATCALAHSHTASNPVNSHRDRRHATHARDLRPGREPSTHQCPIVARLHTMATRSKVVRHLRMHREEALGLPHRFESSHGAFSQARGLVRVLGPVVQQLPTMMRNAGYQILLCRRVAGKLIGHDGSRRIPTAFEQLAKEALRGFRIPALLYQDVEPLIFASIWPTFPTCVDPRGGREGRSKSSTHCKRRGSVLREKVGQSDATINTFRQAVARERLLCLQENRFGAARNFLPHHFHDSGSSIYRSQLRHQPSRRSVFVHRLVRRYENTPE